MRFSDQSNLGEYGVLLIKKSLIYTRTIYKSKRMFRDRVSYSLATRFDQFLQRDRRKYKSTRRQFESQVGVL